MAFAPSKFINAQKTGSCERLLFIKAQACLLDLPAGEGFEALSCKTGTHSTRFCYLLHWLGTSPLADFFAETSGRPPSFSTRAIWFGKAFSARKAFEASFVKDQFHLVPSQRAITLLSLSGIMNFDTHFLTMRTGYLGGCRDHPDPECSIF